jgi:hypothetical protein
LFSGTWFGDIAELGGFVQMVRGSSEDVIFVGPGWIYFTLVVQQSVVYTTRFMTFQNLDVPCKMFTHETRLALPPQEVFEQFPSCCVVVLYHAWRGRADTEIDEQKATVLRMVLETIKKKINHLLFQLQNHVSVRLLILEHLIIDRAGRRVNDSIICK